MAEILRKDEDHQSSVLPKSGQFHPIYVNRTAGMTAVESFAARTGSNKKE